MSQKIVKDPRGKRIIGVRKPTKKEIQENAWVGNSVLPCILVLNDGQEIWALGDEEGNFPGVLILSDPNTGQQQYILEEI